MIRCSQCNRPIGLMVDEKGKDTMFKCPRTKKTARMVRTNGQ
jgi:hypothetical protein